MKSPEPVKPPKSKAKRPAPSRRRRSIPSSSTAAPPPDDSSDDEPVVATPPRTKPRKTGPSLPVSIPLTKPKQKRKSRTVEPQQPPPPPPPPVSKAYVSSSSSDDDNENSFPPKRTSSPQPKRKPQQAKEVETPATKAKTSAIKAIFKPKGEGGNKSGKAGIRVEVVERGGEERKEPVKQEEPPRFLCRIPLHLLSNGNFPNLYTPKGMLQEELFGADEPDPKRRDRRMSGESFSSTSSRRSHRRLQQSAANSQQQRKRSRSERSRHSSIESEAKRVKQDDGFESLNGLHFDETAENRPVVPETAPPSQQQQRPHSSRSSHPWEEDYTSMPPPRYSYLQREENEEVGIRKERFNERVERL